MAAVFWTGHPRPTQEIPLTPERIAIYHVSPEPLVDGEILHELATVLDADERDRWGKLVFAADRHNFLISHALVRFALSWHAGVQPAAWRFHKNHYGRPEIADHSVAQDLRFSLSRTAGRIAVAVACGREVGVDVENVTRELPMDAAELVLSPAELDRVRDLPDANRCERLFALWTLKEAYAKGRGLGLSLPLKEYSFDFDGPPNEATLVSEAGADPGSWLFELHRRRPGALPGAGIRCRETWQSQSGDRAVDSAHRGVIATPRNLEGAIPPYFQNCHQFFCDEICCWHWLLQRSQFARQMCTFRLSDPSRRSTPSRAPPVERLGPGDVSFAFQQGR